jgi:hypothetical protein
MAYEYLDYLVDGHVLSWKADNSYNVNLSGLTCDEKEYIMKKFKERTGGNTMEKTEAQKIADSFINSIKETSRTIGESISNVSKQVFDEELNKYKKEVIILPKNKEYLLGNTSFQIRDFYKKSGQLPTYQGTPVIIVD